MQDVCQVNGKMQEARDRILGQGKRLQKEKESAHP